MPRDAEAWLAERGVRREPIRVRPPRQDSSDGAGDGGGPTEQPGPPVSAREATRLAAQSAADVATRDADAAATPDPAEPRLEVDVSEATAFVRRSTGATPQSEARVRAKLEARGWTPVVVEQAMERARREGLVDDAAMVDALIEERLRKGHAPARIRRDLRTRGFDDRTLDAALVDAESQDLEAAAFAVARREAAGLTGLDGERALRRLVGRLVRRGYPDGLARKVARQAVYDAQDPERTVGH